MNTYVIVYKLLDEDTFDEPYEASEENIIVVQADTEEAAEQYAEDNMNSSETYYIFQTTITRITEEEAE